MSGRPRDGPQHPFGLIVFDFDETIAHTDIGEYHLTDPIKHVFGGKVRKDKIEAMLQTVEEMGFATAALSFNRSYIIEKALQHLKHYFFEILGWDNLEENSSTEAPTKSNWIKQLMAACNIQDATTVCFCDDNNYNIEDVNKNLPDCHTIYIKRGRGMKDVHFEEVTTWVKIQVELSKLNTDNRKIVDAEKFFQVVEQEDVVEEDKYSP